MQIQGTCNFTFMHTWQKHMHEATTGNKSRHRTFKSNEDHITQLAYLFLPFLLQLCNDVLLQYFRCKVKPSHVTRSILRISYLESFKRRAQSTYIVHLDYFHEEYDTQNNICIYYLHNCVLYSILSSCTTNRLYILCGPNYIYVKP